jgi:hypothetical protein
VSGKIADGSLTVVVVARGVVVVVAREVVVELKGELAALPHDVNTRPATATTTTR